jgi:hypothetical protein
MDPATPLRFAQDDKRHHPDQHTPVILGEVPESMPFAYSRHSGRSPRIHVLRLLTSFWAQSQNPCLWLTPVILGAVPESIPSLIYVILGVVPESMSFAYLRHSGRSPRIHVLAYLRHSGRSPRIHVLRLLNQIRNILKPGGL